jgi:RimJ/RimL family protein N-acetyltransferase
VERLSFDDLDATAFEEFGFELLSDLPGFSNVDWRKGTGLDASPADRGRDIVAEVERTDVDGSRHVERWFVDCKHYKRGVPPEALQGVLAWANAERPHVVLIVASNFLSNPTKDSLRVYDRNNRPPFRFKYW